MKETEIEMETVRAQAKLFVGFREQLKHQANRYRAEVKPKLEAVLKEALRS